MRKVAQQLEDDAILYSDDSFDFGSRIVRKREDFVRFQLRLDASDVERDCIF